MDIDIDWKLCFLCQERQSAVDLRSTTEGRTSLASQLIEFKKNGLKIPDAFYTFTDEKELSTHLEQNKASYHKSCFLSYSKSRLERARKKSVEEKSVSRNSRQRSANGTLGESRCCICNVLDEVNNLKRAAELNKKRSVEFDPKKYLTEKTKEWKELAAYENLHSKLCIGDLRANEMFYHLKCWSKLKRDAESHRIYLEEEKSKTTALLKFREKYCRIVLKFGKYLKSIRSCVRKMISNLILM